MKFASVASLLFLANWAAASYCPWTEADLNGTWWNSCSDCSFDQDSCVLSCNCDSISGQSYPSSIDLRNCSAKKVHNDDGSLTCESSFCIWPNRRYYEDLAGTQRSVEINEAFCAQRCRNTTDCLFYTFWNDGGCHIHGADATMSDQWEDGQPIAGNAYCEGYSCMQFNKIGNGGIVPGVSGKHTTTAMYCRNFCRDTEGCLAYTWYKDTWCRIHGDLEYDVVERPGAVYSEVSCATAVPTRSPTAAPSCKSVMPELDFEHYWQDSAGRTHVDLNDKSVLQFAAKGSIEAGINVLLVDSANLPTDDFTEENLTAYDVFIGGEFENIAYVADCAGCAPAEGTIVNLGANPVIVAAEFTDIWMKVTGSVVKVGSGVYDGTEGSVFLNVDLGDANPINVNRAIFTNGYGDILC